MKPKARNPIAQNIKKYRILNDMTQEQLAGLLDLDTRYLLPYSFHLMLITIVTSSNIVRCTRKRVCLIHCSWK